MQNFILVSVAIGFFSGTTLTTKAQSSVNLEQVNTFGVQKKSGKFIEGIEINAGTPVTVPAPVTETPVKKNMAATVENVTVKSDVAAIEKFTLLQFKYAQLLDIDVEQVSDNALFHEIDNWWGTRYKYGGATRAGIDCSAYTGTLIHSIYGVALPRTSRDQYEQCSKLETEELRMGDLVFFKTGRGVSHVGLYLSNGYFTHASTSIGVTISNLSETYWSKKYIGGGRINIPETATE